MYHWWLIIQISECSNEFLCLYVQYKDNTFPVSPVFIRFTTSVFDISLEKNTKLSILPFYICCVKYNLPIVTAKRLSIQNSNNS